MTNKKAKTKGKELSKKESDVKPSEDFLELPDQEDIAEIIESLPEGKGNKLAALLMISQTRHSGPLPSPSVLKGYEQILPNSAERIFKVFEDQAAHRQSLEKKLVDTDSLIESRGQWMAFILAFILIGVGTTLAIFGIYSISGIVFSTTIVGLVATFIYGRNGNKRVMIEDNSNENDE